MNTNRFPLQNDSTWQTALETVRSTIRVPSTLPALVRRSWNGLYTTTDFMHSAGFPGWSPRSILRAASLPSDGENISARDIARGVELIGVRAASAVAAINYACTQVLRSAPPTALWEPLYRELMTEVHVGHTFGEQIEEVGSASGMVIGFVRCAGMAVLLGRLPQEYAKWHAANSESDPSRTAIDAFGCEPYQVGSLLLQQLGFGPEMAIAAAISVGELSYEAVEKSPTIELWQASYRWVRALLNGSSAPTDPISRAVFPYLATGDSPDAVTPQLKALYWAVAHIRGEGSSWIWHLPSPKSTAADLAKNQKKPDGYKTATGLIVDRSVPKKSR